MSKTQRRPSWIYLLLSIPTLSALSACNVPQVAGDPLQPTSTGVAFKGVNCSAVRPQLEPDLMAWDPGSRAKLDRLRRKGVVAVRYAAEGCNVELELLADCIGPGRYEFAPYSANERKVAHNQNELYAALPVGAASLTGKLQGARALRTDYMLAGTHSLPAGATLSGGELSGSDCSRATHVVSAIYVGGFAMTSGESRKMDASASYFGGNTKLRSEAGVESVADEGTAAACVAAQAEHREDDGCAVPLRIGLVPLRAGGSNADSNESLRSSSAPPSPPPPVDVLANPLEAASDVLVAFDAALTADGAGVANPSGARAAWHKVVGTPGKNPYRKLSAERAQAWAAFAHRQKERATRQAAEEARLKRVLPLESLSLEQKDRQLRDYMKAYGRRLAGQLAEVVQPREHRQRLVVSLALPAGKVGTSSEAASLYDKCEQGTLVAACLTLGEAFAQKQLILEGVAPVVTPAATEHEHLLAAAELYQLACDQRAEEGCLRRAELKLTGDANQRTQALKQAFEIRLEQCAKSKSSGVCKACEVGLSRVERLGDGEATRAARSRTASALELGCQAGNSAACTCGAEHFSKLSDQGAVLRVKRKRVELELGECRGGEAHSCSIASIHFRDADTADSKLASETDQRALELFTKQCAEGHANSCNWLGDRYEQAGEPRKAAEIYKKTCAGELNEYDDALACRNLYFLYDAGAKGFPADKNLAKKYNKRACSLIATWCD